ncbi:glycosyltransferase family 2 protein [Pseudonocardia nigra]|uniref:glycosyltransferase family 2 protein n=1 Tax=Pseudonocardia nigra TaxID=1921578 RepID=UPI001C5E2BD2|nr:glycosyltransferase family 2 protein [Pseudonocardia nigra]
MTDRLPLSYVLPLKAAVADPELRDHVRWLADRVAEVIVVDGSAPPIWALHRSWWGPPVRHVRPDPARECANGKVWGVLTGLRLAGHDGVVVADDDVRWDLPGLRRALALLNSADLVAPANHYDPMPWHARYDTARTLIHRALGADWPGTLALRRSALTRVGGGYDGDVLFENLELVRTVEAAGGRAVWPLDLFVLRRAPDTRHFLGQRVRQAYDEFARPAHLMAALALLPLVAAAVAQRRRGPLLAVLAAVIAWAEIGRRRGGGTKVYPASSALLAPLWVLERGVCMWVALWWRLRGGVPYAGRRLRRAATSPRELRRRLLAGQVSTAAATSPEAVPAHV